MQNGDPIAFNRITVQIATLRVTDATPYCAFFWNSSKRLRCISSNVFGSVAGPSYTLAKFSSGSTSEIGSQIAEAVAG